MIALHSAMSPVTDAGSSGTTRVAEASRIQLLPLVIKVMASLLARADVMRDKPKAVARAGFSSWRLYKTRVVICGRDARMSS